MTAADPISLGCLSHLRQPLPAPHSRSLQVILNPPADRGPARIRPACWPAVHPAGCQAGGACALGPGHSGLSLPRRGPHPAKFSIPRPVEVKLAERGEARLEPGAPSPRPGGRRAPAGWPAPTRPFRALLPDPSCPGVPSCPEV